MHPNDHALYYAMFGMDFLFFSFFFTAVLKLARGSIRVVFCLSAGHSSYFPLVIKSNREENI